MCMCAVVKVEVVLVVDEAYAQGRMKIALSEYYEGRGWGGRVRVTSEP